MEPIGSKTKTGLELPGHAFAKHRSDFSIVDALVDPAAVFRDPGEVVDHSGLTRDEKRTILLSWVRDEMALAQLVEAATSDLRRKTCLDAVIEALSHFDPCAAGEYLSAAARTRVAKARRKGAH